MWKRVRKFTLYLLVILILLVGVGTVYQWYGAIQDKKTYGPVGKMYEVADYKMHLYAKGEGDLTVVFASGWGTASPSADFYPLYEGLQQNMKIAVYDRFGYGFSDTTGRKRDIDTITDEIHELLQVSGQKPPYIFVGHSLGSLETIRYAQRFPDEVKAILFIEGGSPEYYASQKPITFMPIIHRVFRTTGVLRALSHVKGFNEWTADQSNGQELLPNDQKELYHKAMLLKTGNRDMTDEIRQSQKNAQIILDSKQQLDIPITVLTADYFGKLSDDKSWMDSQAMLPAWSVSGKQIIVPDSSHYIHSYKPELVIKELLKLAER